MKLIPRDYQVESVKALFEYFRTHPEGNPVIGLPTGTGKSVVIAHFLEEVYRQYPKQKILIGTHVKELIKQNHDELLGMWPHAPAGIYSAGLNRKDIYQRIIFCGIASINKNIEQFGHVDLFMVDECHLISQEDESMYLKAISVLKAKNPYLKVIGLTATPWRAGQGRITDCGIFTDMAIDLTDMKSFNRFIAEGHLVPLVPKRTDTQLDVSAVKVRGGEYLESDLQQTVNKDHITRAALNEVLEHGASRRHWLIFGSGIDHVKRITELLIEKGITACNVHSKMTSKQRDQNIADWKAGKYQAMVNNGILTTGVNFRALDMIVMLRPTKSTVLWVQMLGRGTRPSPETYKENCLVLDFAGNTGRLGPINDPVIPKRKGEPTGEVPIKICEGCGTYNHISARYCGGQAFSTAAGCGAEFVFKTLLHEIASGQELIRQEELPIIEIIDIEHVTFALHKKMGKPDSVKVTYYAKFAKYVEYVLFEHEGFGRRKARQWWAERTTMAFPERTEEALRVIDHLAAPSQLRVWVNKKYPEIMSAIFIKDLAIS